MARSLKSKRRKKLNKIKRERYGKKEMIRLKKMLGLPTGEKIKASADTEVKAEPEISDIANVVDIKKVQQSQQPFEVHNVDDAEMEEEDDIIEIHMKRTHKIRKSHRPKARIKDPLNTENKDKAGEGTNIEKDQMDHDQKIRYDEKTHRNQHGNYPIWMNQKSVQKLAKMNKKMKRLIRKKNRRAKRSHRYSKETMETDTAGLSEAIVGLEKFGVNTPSL